VAAINKIIHGSHNLANRCAALLGGDTHINHHGAKFSIPVSWKFFVYLYLGFAALLSELHLPHTAILHLLVGRNRSPSKFCVCSVRGILLPVFHQKFCCRNYTKCMPLVNMSSILTTTQMQHNRAILAYTRYKQKLSSLH
jgi:hypothetical protein